MAVIELSDDVGIECGGKRSGICTWLLPDGSPLGEAGMFGSAYGEAYVESSSVLHAVWFSTILFGDVPTLGPCIMRYSEARRSTVRIVSADVDGDPFFPAEASQVLWYALEPLDDAGVPRRTLYNLDPMVMSATIEQIPPVGSNFLIPEDVLFYDVTSSTPEPVIVLAARSTGLVGESGGIDFAFESDIDRDRGTFAVRCATAAQPTDPLNWVPFAVGRVSLTRRRQGAVVRDPAGAVEFSGTFDPSDARATLVVHAVAPDAEGEAHRVLYLARA